MKGVSANFGNQPAPASSPSGDTRVPDPLIPLLDPYTGAPLGQPFYVDEEANQPIFVDLQVPKGTAAGTYTGKVHVTSAHGQSADVPLSVVVWDLDLPDMRSVTTHFKMSTENLLAYHKDTATCAEGSCYLAETPESKKIVKRYQELAHSHRIDTAQEFRRPPLERVRRLRRAHRLVGLRRGHGAVHGRQLLERRRALQPARGAPSRPARPSARTALATRRSTSRWRGPGPRT